MKQTSLRVVIALIALVIVASAILCLRTAWAQQPADLKIVDLKGHSVLHIETGGSVFDSSDQKVAVINDQEGSLTLLKDDQKIIFTDDPAIQRDQDRYRVKLGGGVTFEVKPNGDVLFNGELYWRVSGYARTEVQRNRFIAALVIIPVLKPKED